MATIITGLLLSVLPGFYLTYVNVWQRDTGRLGAVERADFALRRMEQDVRNARSAAVSSDGTVVILTLPKRAYDASVGRPANLFDSNGSLIDGDRVRYWFVLDPHGTGSLGGAIYRQVTRVDGTQGSARVVADGIYPGLNPRGSGTSDPCPVFVYDAALRTVAATVTAVEPKPSSGSFLVTQTEPKCRRDGGNLIRVPTAEHLEGEIQCSVCGDQAKPTGEVVTYQTQLMVRNL